MPEEKRAKVAVPAEEKRKAETETEDLRAQGDDKTEMLLEFELDDVPQAA